MPKLNQFDQKIVNIRMSLAQWAINSTSKHFDFSSTRISADETKLSAQEEDGKLKKHDDRVNWLRDNFLKKTAKDPANFHNEAEKKDYMYTLAAAAMKKETGNCLEQALSGLVMLDKEIQSLKKAITREIEKTRLKIQDSKGMRLHNDTDVEPIKEYIRQLETLRENLNFETVNNSV